MSENHMNIPKHVAIIMDGNGRWAIKRGLPRIMGHREGVKAVRSVIEAARELGIKYLSLFAFSTENWSRPKNEVRTLFRLLAHHLKKERNELKNKDIRLIVIGDRTPFSDKLKKLIDETEEFLKNCTSMYLILAVNYGGRQDIINACKNICKVALKQEDIKEEIFSKYLMTHNIPDPDLLIRTSGEMRISNFYLYQLAYTELYFTKRLWPDFTKKDFYLAIKEYSKRTRKFGRV
ncbi:MAG: isoprenyl transferase [bacterium]|nr:isoprenyl transferase [bacterium]